MPEYVTFYLAMGVHMARRRSHVGGGGRLYVMAKALDVIGLGMIRRDDLQAYSKALGVNVRTYQRWMKEARNHGLFTDIQKGDDWWLILPNPGAAAYGMGCEVGYRKATIPANLLAGQGWKAYIWAATEAARGQQISRERLQKVYNVPARTQRYRSEQAGVKRQRNYSKSNLTADSLAITQEYSKHKGAFVAGNKLIYWRLPDTRTTDQATDAGKGRARKANRAFRILQNQKALFQMQQGLTDDFEYAEFIRLFNRTPEQRKATEKRWARSDNRIREIYELSHLAESSGAGIWMHIPR